MTYLPQIRILVPSAQVSSFTTGSFNLPSARGAFDPPQSGLAVFATGSAYESFNFATNGNGSSFGSTNNQRSYTAAIGSATRGVYCGGYQGTQKTMEYITFASAGNGTTFGNLVNEKYFAAGSGSSTRGIISGGYPNTAYEYITIASTGNSTAFGNATGGTKEAIGAFSSSTRSLDFGGSDTGNDDTIRYITIASTGNGTSFGTLTTKARYTHGGCSTTRGLRMGGRVSTSPTVASNVIDYVTIATTGNATDFGDLTVARFYHGAASNNIRCVAFGGGNDTTDYNIIDGVTIATLGNAIDIGDAPTTGDARGGASNSHGGLF